MTRTGRRVIVVTGTPRSGTTPVGDALAAARGARTLYEPLNRHVGDRRIQRYFEVPGSAGFTRGTVDEFVRDVRALRLRLRPGVFPENQGVRRVLKRVVGSRTRMTYRACRLDPALRTIVWKDPFAAFLAEHLADRHGIPVVVTVRPPHAVAASFKRLGWRFDVAGLVRRLGDEGHRYEELVERVDLEQPTDNAAVLWHIVYDTLWRARDRVAGIHFVDLEDLVVDPATEYRRLYRTLALPWGRAIERHLARTADRGGPEQPDVRRAHVAARDVSAVNRYWVDVLAPREAETVEDLDAELWQRLRGIG